MDEVIAKSAAELRRSYSIKTCDSLHVATALRYEVPIFHTYDGLAEDGTIKPRPFLLAFDGIFGESDKKLRIEVPSDPRPKTEDDPAKDQLKLFIVPDNK